MDTAKANELLRWSAFARRSTADMTAAGRADTTAANQTGDMFDSAQPLTDEGTDASVRVELEQRLVQSVGRRGVSLPVHMAIQFEVASRFPTNVLNGIRCRADRRRGSSGG